MKTNYDGTITLLPENTWTSCGACGQRVTADSIHTCSPQTKPLSDEEIADAKRYKYLKENCYKPTNPNNSLDNSMTLKFWVSGIWKDNLDPRVLDGLIDEEIEAIEAKVRGQ